MYLITIFNFHYFYSVYSTGICRKVKGMYVAPLL